MRNILTRTLILRLAIISVTGFLAVQTAAQESASTPKVHVIPQPRQMTVSQEQFHISPATTVSLADPRSEEDRFAAQDFVDDLKATTGVMLKIGKSRPRSILIGTIDQVAVQAALKRATLIASADLDAEGYLLSVNAKEVVVAGKTATGVF